MHELVLVRHHATVRVLTRGAAHVGGGAANWIRVEWFLEHEEVDDELWRNVAHALQRADIRVRPFERARAPRVDIAIGPNANVVAFPDNRDVERLLASSNDHQADEGPPPRAHSYKLPSFFPVGPRHRGRLNPLRTAFCGRPGRGEAHAGQQAAIQDRARPVQDRARPVQDIGSAVQDTAGTSSVTNRADRALDTGSCRAGSDRTRLAPIECAACGRGERS
jgi:hypothetical protein